jgi:hypothetical protein
MAIYMKVETITELIMLTCCSRLLGQRELRFSAVDDDPRLKRFVCLSILPAELFCVAGSYVLVESRVL